MLPSFGKGSEGEEKIEVTKIPESGDEPFKDDDSPKERRIFL